MFGCSCRSGILCSGQVLRLDSGCLENRCHGRYFVTERARIDLQNSHIHRSSSDPSNSRSAQTLCYAVETHTSDWSFLWDSSSPRMSESSTAATKRLRQRKLKVDAARVDHGSSDLSIAWTVCRNSRRTKSSPASKDSSDKFRKLTATTFLQVRPRVVRGGAVLWLMFESRWILGASDGSARS